MLSCFFVIGMSGAWLLGFTHGAVNCDPIQKRAKYASADFEEETQGNECAELKNGEPSKSERKSKLLNQHC